MKNSLDILLMCQLKAEGKFLDPRRYLRSVSNPEGHAEGIQRNGPSVNETEQMRLRLSKNLQGEIKPVASTSMFSLSRKNFLEWPPLARGVDRGFSDLSMRQNQLEGWVKHRWLILSPDILIQYILGRPEKLHL